MQKRVLCYWQILHIRLFKRNIQFIAAEHSLQQLYEPVLLHNFDQQLSKRVNDWLGGIAFSLGTGLDMKSVAQNWRVSMLPWNPIIILQITYSLERMLYMLSLLRRNSFLRFDLAWIEVANVKSPLWKCCSFQPNILPEFSSSFP